MANENVIEAKKVRLTLRDGNEYVIMPLPLNKLIDVWDIIVSMEDKEKELTVDMVKNMRILAYTVLKGQHSIHTDENAGELVDMGDMQKIIPAIIGVNADVISKLTEQ